MNKVIQQFISFGFVGVFAALIDFGLLIIMTDIFGIHYTISVAVAYVVSTIFNYYASMKFVFRSKYDRNQKYKEFIIFIILSIMGLGLNEGIVVLLVETYYLYYVYSKLIATIVVMLWNFITRKIFLEEKM